MAEEKGLQSGGTTPILSFSQHICTGPIHAEDMQRAQPLRSFCHRGMRNAVLEAEGTSGQKGGEGFSPNMGHLQKSMGRPTLTVGMEGHTKENWASIKGLGFMGNCKYFDYHCSGYTTGGKADKRGPDCLVLCTLCWVVWILSVGSGNDLRFLIRGVARSDLDFSKIVPLGNWRINWGVEGRLKLKAGKLVWKLLQ